MKILFHHRTVSRDGQAVHIDELASAFRRLGHDVVIVGPGPAGEQTNDREDGFVPFLKAFLPKFLYELLELGYSVLSYRRLARAAGTHHPDVLYERYNLFGLAGMWLRRRSGLPMVLEVNAPICEERSVYGGIALGALARWSERATWCGADCVLPVTSVLAEHVRRAGVAAGRITVVPNGVDPKRFADTSAAEDVRERLGLSDRFVLGFTGFVREWHGMEGVVDLLAEIDDPRLHLLVVGDGPSRSDLEARARRLDIVERVHITGIVARDSVASYIAAFDVALQPSVVPYASPLKLFEYLAMGRPVVAPRTPNIEEILTDRETALLFPPGDKQAFRSCVERLRADAALRQRLGAAGQRLITERDLTWDGNARRIAELMTSMLAEKARVG